jgi:hypothetical protein
MAATRDVLQRKEAADQAISVAEPARSASTEDESLECEEQAESLMHIMWVLPSAFAIVAIVFLAVLSFT